VEGFKEPRLLFVDDESTMLRCYARLYAGKEYGVLTCQDPVSALEIIRQNSSLVVVVSDYQMGNGMNGEMFLNEVRNIRPDIIRMLASTYGTADFKDPSLVQFEFQKPVATSLMMKITDDSIQDYIDNKLK